MRFPVRASRSERRLSRPVISCRQAARTLSVSCGQHPRPLELRSAWNSVSARISMASGLPIKVLEHEAVYTVAESAQLGNMLSSAQMRLTNIGLQSAIVSAPKATIGPLVTGRLSKLGRLLPVRDVPWPIAERPGMVGSRQSM